MQATGCVRAPLPWRDFYNVERTEPVGEDVRDIVIRWQGCSHFAGEEPYDAERAAMIDRAMRELRCESLEHDSEVAQADHADDAEALALLAEVKP